MVCDRIQEEAEEEEIEEEEVEAEKRDRART